MAASINNGWVNFRASNFMAKYTNKIANNVTRLSGNTRFATGADNPSALAYGVKMRSAATIATQTVEGVQNAQTKAKIAGSAYSSAIDALAQAKDLIAQKEANVDTDLGNATAATQITTQIDNIKTAATFNGTSVVGGNISFNLPTDAGVVSAATTVAMDDISVGAKMTTDDLQGDVETLLGSLAKAGGAEAGLGYLADFLTSKAGYMQEAAANATNVNITTEMSDYVSNQIALQSAQFIAAQQNQNAYSVLNLLK